MAPFPPFLMYQIISFTLSTFCESFVIYVASMKVLINESMTPKCVKYIWTNPKQPASEMHENFTPKLVQKISWKKGGGTIDPRNKLTTFRSPFYEIVIWGSFRLNRYTWSLLLKCIQRLPVLGADTESASNRIQEKNPRNKWCPNQTIQYILFYLQWLRKYQCITLD